VLRKMAKLSGSVLLTFGLITQPLTVHAHGIQPWQREIIQAASVEYDVWEWKLEETVHCESGHFSMAVITGKRLGLQGEIGAVQLHPRGLLPVFYRMGYSNPLSFTQSVYFLAEMVAKNPRNRFAWTCYPR
jgi:hypothetical protein